jgi:hypothetical protein
MLTAIAKDEELKLHQQTQQAEQQQQQGYSPSKLLNDRLKHLHTFQAFPLITHIGYIDTHQNPADALSRQLDVTALHFWLRLIV